VRLSQGIDSDIRALWSLVHQSTPIERDAREQGEALLLLQQGSDASGAHQEALEGSESETWTAPLGDLEDDADLDPASSTALFLLKALQVSHVSFFFSEIGRFSLFQLSVYFPPACFVLFLL